MPPSAHAITDATAVQYRGADPWSARVPLDPPRRNLFLQIFDPQLHVSLGPRRLEFAPHRIGCFHFVLSFEALEEAKKHAAITRRALDAFAKHLLRLACLSGPQQ